MTKQIQLDVTRLMKQVKQDSLTGKFAITSKLFLLLQDNIYLAYLLKEETKIDLNQYANHNYS